MRMYKIKPNKDLILEKKLQMTFLPMILDTQTNHYFLAWFARWSFRYEQY